MKYFKLFLTVFAMAIAMNVSAQSKTTAKSKTTTAKTTTTTTAKKAATTTAKPATTTAKTATTTTAAKPAAAPKTTTTTTTTKTATASASKPAASKPAKTSSFSSGDYDPGYHLMLETKIGSYYGTGGFGENIVLEHEFHKYFAWDIFSIDYSAPFKVNAMSIGLKTGIRAFSPYFWDTVKMRAYSSLAVGYDCGLSKNPWTNDWSAGHGFGLSFGVGVQMVDHVYVGYTLEYSTAWKSTSHFAKIAYRF